MFTKEQINYLRMLVEDDFDTMVEPMKAKNGPEEMDEFLENLKVIRFRQNILDILVGELNLLEELEEVQ